MTWRTISGAALVLALSGCGEGDGETGNAPPVEGTGPNTLTAADTGQPASGSGGSGDATMSDSMMDASATMADSSTGPPEMFTVISGAFVNGGGTIDLPIECRIRFWRPGQIEPSTGVYGDEFVFQRSGFVIDEFPQAYSISNEMVPMVEFGMVGYAGAQCDADGNGQFDDEVGGFFPTIPLEMITVPSSGVDFAIAPF